MSEAERLLHEALREQRERVGALEGILNQRAGAIGGAVIDWLGFTLRAARSGDPAARKALMRLTEQLDEARALGGNIEVVNFGDPPKAG